MLQYLVILLDDTSVAYCHAANPLTERNIIPLDTLKKAILYGMKENLMIQLSSDKSAVTLSFFSKKFIGENLRKSFFPKDSETKKNSEPPEPSKKKKSKFKKFFKSIFH